MTISEKLDFLMTLTGTSNSALARSLSYDTSYISRIRAGKRGLPRRQPFLEPVSIYFARGLTTPVQRSAAATLLTPGQEWPADPAHGAARILRWLSATPEDISAPIGALLQSISSSQDRPPLPEADAMAEPPLLEDPALFYGNQGKRAVVLRFLSDLCADGKAHHLSLVSDEAMDWLTGDPAFVRTWSALLLRLLAQGGQITIIHSISRDLGEMLEAVQKWIPLYLTGRILPYYCPQLRDGICRRSLFVCAGQAAVMSSSIRDQTEGMVTLYLRNPQAVAALEQEFANYLALCRPLMEIYQYPHRPEVEARLTALVSSRAPLVFAGPTLLPLAGDPPPFFPTLLPLLQDRLDAGGSVTELLCLPELPTGPEPVPLCDLWDRPNCVRSIHTLWVRLSAAIERMAACPNYRLIITDRLPANVCLMAAGQEEVLLFPAAPPTTVFDVTEPRMTAALWDHLQRAEAKSGQGAALTRLRLRLSALEALERNLGMP